MRKFLWLVPALAIAMTPSFASTPKEIRGALKEKYQITKRALTGGIKTPGTVLYINLPGVTVEPPRMNMTPVVIKDGELDPSSPSAGENRVAIPVGEPMHIYTIRTNKDSIMLLLGTETTFPKVVMGTQKETHFQTAMLFKFDDGLNSLTVEDALAAVASVAPTEQEAADYPDLLAAAERARSTNAANLEARARQSQQYEEERRQARAQPSTAAAAQSTPTSSSPSASTPSSAAQPGNSAEQKTPEQLRTEELKALADERYAAKWDAELSSSEPWENVADLLKYSPAKTMAALAQGHRIVLEVGDIAFAQGSMVAEGYHPYTDIYEGIKEQVQREFGRDGSRGGWAEWFEMTSRASEDRYVKLLCMVDPAEAAVLEAESSYVVNATLQEYMDREYSGPQALLKCSDIVPVQ